MREKRYLFWAPVLAGSLAVSGCAARPAREPSAEMTTEEAGPAANGNFVRPLEEKAGPEDDFYEYVNRELLEKQKIPEDSNNWGYFYALGNETYEKLDAILQETVKNRAFLEEGSMEQKMADLYGTAMDLTGRDEAGLGALKGYLTEIRQAGNIPEYLAAVARIERELGLGSLIQIEYDADMGDSARYACYVGAGDLGLGKETLEDESQTALHGEYRNYIAAMLGKAGVLKEKTGEAADQVFSFMKEMASSALPLADAGDPSKIYHPYTGDEVRGLAYGSDLSAVLEGSGAGNWENYIVMEPEYLAKLGGFLTEGYLPVLKDYSSFCLLHDLGAYLTTDIRNQVLEFRQYRDGSARRKTDEKLASQMTQGLLKFEFGRLYVERYFSAESRRDVEEMVQRILDAYQEKIDGLDWMSSETKEAAGKKLQTMVLKIGYPDHWPEYHEEVRIIPPEQGGVLIDNVLELLKANTAYERKRAREPVNRTAWLMSPQTVNAYYNPLVNEIVFPAAILQPPFYDPDAGDAKNLGGIGMVIAHEITHAFDDSGSQYDENGNYHVWWSEKDYENFAGRTGKVVEYYDGYEGFDGIHVNGKQTLGENIADLGAVSCVMQIVGDDPERLRELCENYARIWASNYTDESMRMRLSTDVHAPSKVRVNAVLSSMEGFYLAYPEIGEGDAMYVPPKKRVKVW